MSEVSLANTDMHCFCRVCSRNGSRWLVDNVILKSAVVTLLRFTRLRVKMTEINVGTGTCTEATSVAFDLL